MNFHKRVREKNRGIAMLFFILLISGGGVSPVLAAAPSNDDMVNATEISALPFADTPITDLATLESGEPSYSCGYGIDKTVWYRYKAMTSGIFAIDTGGSDFNTVVHVFLDDPTPTFFDCDDNGGEGNTELLLIDGVAGVTYLIGIGGVAAEGGNLVLNVYEPDPFTTCAAVIDVPQAECEALEDLYTTTAGPSWTNHLGWLAVNQVCAWEGVGCASSTVDQLRLLSNNLVGPLSADLSVLSGVWFIDFAGNSLSGDLATVVGNLPAGVTMLYLSHNDFTGEIPPGVSSLSALSTLSLTSNNLSGDLSTQTPNLPSGLGALWINGNNFTGPFPSSLASLTSLWGLDIGSNDLSDDLDNVIGYLPAGIAFLSFANNEISGTFPAATASLTNLWFLSAEGNLLDGDLSAAIGNMPASLQVLYLNNNNFFGTIPSSISSLSALREFTLYSNNLLVGTIPLSITTLLDMDYFYFNDTYLCEPPEASYSSWKAGIFSYNPGICGYAPEDFTIVGMYATPAVPESGVPFTFTVQVRNVGGTASTPAAVDIYPNRVPAGTGDPGDHSETFGSIEPGYVMDVPFAIPGQPGGVHDLYGYVDNADDVVEWLESNNQFGPQEFIISSILFEDDFETGDFSLWTRFNDGKGYLYPCTDAAINGTWGACVDRGTDKRKQLIDETPVDQKDYNVRFNFDINSLSMAAGSRFRFMQVKMGAARPFFIVMKYQGGNYLIQLNTLLDDLTKVKSGWYVLSNAPHTIEVNWSAAAGVATNDGSVEFYLDDLLLETLSALDNDTIYVDTFKIGFTSRLDGKPISGIFYLDDIATSNSIHIGLP